MDEEAQAVLRRRGKWSQKDVPHLGWSCVEEYDAKEETGDLITCEMCEIMDVRFVHVMAHERYPERLHCGCICAGHMSGEKKGAEERDKRMRSRARRRETFHKRKGWKISRQGASYIEIDGFHLVIGRKANGQFQVGAKGPRDAKHRWGTKRYATLEEAKIGCFDALEFVEGEQREAGKTARRALINSILN